MFAEEREAKLPQWAKELIKNLRIRNKHAEEGIMPLRKMIDNLKKQGREKQDRIDAMIAMFQCAAKGGNEVALAVKRIVEDWIVSDAE